MRALILVCGLGSLAACIQPTLTRCGDLACPADKVCNDLVGCVYPDQLTHCEGAADGTACSFTSAPSGSCEGGICLPLGCGNGFKTTDEVCEDGNNVNGDGCSADCTSVEVCGNGIVDLAMNEQCDDANTDDLDACRNDCVLPHCNDGIVDSLEECDPSSTDALTESCGDFGYYTGALACSATCRFDPAGSCAGRCGDLVIDAPQGEECDGAIPTFSCVDAGFDFGAITCSPTTCTADTARSCERFGWRYLHDTVSPVRLAADRATIAIAGSSGLDVGDAGTWTQLAGSYTAVDVRGTQVLAATATTVQLRDQGMWTTLPAPPLTSGTTIVEAVLARDDATPTVLASSATACDVHQLDQGAWITTAQPVGCSHVEAAALADFATASGTTVTWTYPGGPRSDAVTGGVFALERRAADLYVYAYDPPPSAAAYETRIPPSGVPVFKTIATAYSAMAAEMVAFQDDVFAANSISPAATSLLRASAGRIETTSLPLRLGVLPFHVYRGREGAIYATGDPVVNGAGRAGIYELGPYASTTRAAPTTPTGLVGLADDGALLVCDENNLYVSSNAGFQTFGYSVPTPVPQCRAPPWGPAGDDVYVIPFIGPASSPLLRRHGGVFTEQKVGASSIRAVQVTGEGATTVVVQGGSAVILSNPGGMFNTWTGLPAAPCNVNVAAVAGGNVYAAAHCATPTPALKIWRLDATTWTELYSDGALGIPGSLLVTPDGTIAVATTNRDVALGVAGSWQSFPALGNRVVGTSATDVYVLFSGPGLHSVLSHWDGSRWAPIRVDPSVVYTSVIASADDVALLGGAWTGVVRGR
jgi:cysteine-rich repeat protein